MNRMPFILFIAVLIIMITLNSVSAVQFNVKAKLLDVDSISEDIGWTELDASQYQPWELGLRTAYFSMHTRLYSTCEDDNVLFQIRPYGDNINMREQKIVSTDSSFSQGDDHVQYVQMPINSSNKLEYRITGLSCSEADVELWAHEAKDYHIGDIATCIEGSSIREIHDDGTVECETDDNDGSPWTQDGSDISYTNGSVGIGAPADSDAQLYVEVEPYNVLGIDIQSAGDGIRISADSDAGIGVSAHGNYGITAYGSSTGIVAQGNQHGVFSLSSTGIAGYFESGSGYGLIVAQGNVGIGTEDPEATLNVQGGNIQVGASTGLHTTLAGNDLQFNRDGNSYISQMGTGSLVFTTNGGSGSPRMTINSAGNVGIGTTSPTQRLYVAGNIYATGTITPGSSRELKEDIRSLTTEEAEDALENLQPTKFYYKADKTDEHLGFIAEDVPKLLATADRKGVNPMDVVAVLTKIVQEQQKVIAELREQNKVMYEEIKGLKREVKLRGSIAMVETH